MGRVDDVLNVAGHRLRHDGGRERAGLAPEGRRGRGGRPARRAQGPGDRRVRHAAARASTADDALEKELREHVGEEIGALARPDEIRFTDALPKTRIGQDHAAAAARRRRGRAGARRHDDARGSGRARAARAELRGRGVADSSPSSGGEARLGRDAARSRRRPYRRLRSRARDPAAARRPRRARSGSSRARRRGSVFGVPSWTGVPLGIDIGFAVAATYLQSRPTTCSWALRTKPFLSGRWRVRDERERERARRVESRRPDSAITVDSVPVLPRMWPRTSVARKRCAACRRCRRSTSESSHAFASVGVACRVGEAAGGAHDRRPSPAA